MTQEGQPRKISDVSPEEDNNSFERDESSALHDKPNAMPLTPKPQRTNRLGSFAAILSAYAIAHVSDSNAVHERHRNKDYKTSKAWLPLNGALARRLQGKAHNSQLFTKYEGSSEGFVLIQRRKKNVYTRTKRPKCDHNFTTATHATYTRQWNKAYTVEPEHKLSAPYLYRLPATPLPPRRSLLSTSYYCCRTVHHASPRRRPPQVTLNSSYKRTVEFLRVREVALATPVVHDAFTTFLPQTSQGEATAGDRSRTRRKGCTASTATPSAPPPSSGRTSRWPPRRTPNTSVRSGTPEGSKATAPSCTP
ncbi:unnamed protein product [Ectocarpus sp. 4 AP-2014]